MIVTSCYCGYPLWHHILRQVTTLQKCEYSFMIHWLPAWQVTVHRDIHDPLNTGLTAPSASGHSWSTECRLDSSQCIGTFMIHWMPAWQLTVHQDIHDPLNAGLAAHSASGHSWCTECQLDCSHCIGTFMIHWMPAWQLTEHRDIHDPLNASLTAHSASGRTFICSNTIHTDNIFNYITLCLELNWIISNMILEVSILTVSYFILFCSFLPKKTEIFIFFFSFLSKRWNIPCYVSKMSNTSFHGKTDRCNTFNII